MRFLFGWFVAVAIGGAGPTTFGEPSDDPKPQKLGVGDPAPPLRVTKWLTGTQVTRFEPGKVYVVEFWATWCGPCIGAMPHLGRLQTEFKDKGLTVVGVTARDDQNTAEAVEAFVARRGKWHPYTFAYCEGRETYDEYVKASGHEGLPIAFVVGPTGRIEFVGHSMELDLIVPRVLAGTWKGQPDIDEVRAEFARFAAIVKKGQTNAAEALKEFSAFEAAHPKLVEGYYYQLKKLQLLLAGKRYEDAKNLTGSYIRAAAESRNTMFLNGIQLMWSHPLTNPDKKYLRLALHAAEAELALEGDRNAAVLFRVAEGHALVGDAAKAREFGAKAIGAAGKADRKGYEDRLKKLLDR